MKFSKNSETYRHYQKLAAQLTVAKLSGTNIPYHEPSTCKVKGVYEKFLKDLLEEYENDNK